MTRTIKAALALMLLATAASAQETVRLYLSGTGLDDTKTWQFRCSAGQNSGKWGTIEVPSQWELQGYGIYNYGMSFAPRGAGFDEGEYKYSFKVPASWRGKDVKIVFEGSMTDTEVRINGKSAGPVHQGGFYRFEYNVSSIVSYGASNKLEVKVKKESGNASVNNAERHADWWNFGGIYRPVYLTATAKEHIEYFALDARADGSMTVDLDVRQAPQGSKIRYSLASLKEPGKQLDAKELPLKEASERHTLKWKEVDAWECEHPNLYVLTMELVSPKGTVLHKVNSRVGFRTVELRPMDGLYVNDVKVVLKGINRHTFHPEGGRCTSPSISLQDGLLIKEMNMNAVRSHYPPDQHFLDVCDSLGIFYLDELAGWHGRYDDEVGPVLVTEMVRRDVNHPCVIIWDNGNEGGWNTNLDHFFYDLDPQKRHVIHPWADFDDLDTHHYPTYLTGVGRFTNGYKVFMPTEFMHTNSDQGGGAGLEDFWENWMTHPLFAGGFIWAFIDESVVRTDQDGILDSSRDMGNDGVVGPYREKEGSFYAIRDIWSPIQFRKLYITPSFKGDFFVTNRFLYSNLNSCTMKYKLKMIFSPMQGNGKGSEIEIASGDIKMPDLVPGTTGILHMDLPQGFEYSDLLEMEAFDESGRSIGNWSWPIHYAADYYARHNLPFAQDNQKAAFAQKDSTVLLSGKDVVVAFNANTGDLLDIKVAGKTVPFGNMRPVGIKVKPVSSYTRQDGNDALFVAKYYGAVDSIVWRMKPDGLLGMDAVLLNRDNGGIRGGFDDGFMDTDVKDLGFSFDFPEENVSGVQWFGRGPYRVWKDRIRGHNIGLWHKDYNNTITGKAVKGKLEYPEFKGYHGNVYWAKLESEKYPLTVYSETDGLFFKLYNPQEAPGTFSKIFPVLPEGDLSFLLDIQAIKSFKDIPQKGPHSQPGNIRIKSGDDGLKMKLWFRFNNDPVAYQAIVRMDNQPAVFRGTFRPTAMASDNSYKDNTPDSLDFAKTARPVAGSSRKGGNPVLFLVGDSTMRTGTRGNGDNGQWGWGYYAHKYYDEEKITVENHALGGLSIRTFYTGWWPDVLKGVQKGDYVIIQLGHNDSGSYDSPYGRSSIPGTGKETVEVTNPRTNVTETVYSFGEYLRKYCAEIRAKGANPIFFTLTPRNQREEDGSIRRKKDTYNPWIKAVAEELNVPFVDFEDISAKELESWSRFKVDYMFYKDNIHSSEYGAAHNAYAAAEAVAACAESDLKDYLLPREKWLPVQEFKREPGKPALIVTGDSTIQNNDSDPDGMWGWGSVLETVFDPSRITLVNAGKAGRSARTFLDEGRWEKVYNSIQPGDFVVIQFGHNDFGGINTAPGRGEIRNTSDSTKVFFMMDRHYEVVRSYGWYLRKFIDEVREKGATPILCSTTPRNIWTDAKIERREEFIKYMQEVCAQTGVDFVDILKITADYYDSIGNEEASKYFKNDHTHSSRLGAERNAKSFAEGLESINHPLSKYLK